MQTIHLSSDPEVLTPALLVVIENLPLKGLGRAPLSAVINQISAPARTLPTSHQLAA